MLRRAGMTRSGHPHAKDGRAGGANAGAPKRSRHYQALLTDLEGESRRLTAFPGLERLRSRGCGLCPHTQHMRDRVGQIRAVEGIEVEFIHAVRLQ
jgi:hypothetical protein